MKKKKKRAKRVSDSDEKINENEVKKAAINLDGIKSPQLSEDSEDDRAQESTIENK